MKTTTKICSQCKIEKSITEFRLRPDNGKYRNKCKECSYKSTAKYKNRKMIPLKTKEEKKQQAQEYYQKNKEKIAESRKEYYNNNKEQFKEKARENYQHNKDRRKLTSRIWTENNKEYVKEQYKKWREENKGHLEEYMKSYRAKNKEKILISDRMRNKTENRKLQLKNKSSRRRAKEKQGDVTHQQLKELIFKTKKCYWCNKSLNGKYHIDHYVPLSKDGKHTISNLVLSCATCNLQKNNKNPIEFANSRGRLL